jgi:hypothetical protein
MSINASAGRIAALTRDLETKWHQTRDLWTDQRSREFEQKYIQELVSSVNSMVACAVELDKILSKVRRDCE